MFPLPKRRSALIAAIVAPLLALSACSAGAGDDDTASGETQVATIGVISPLTGLDAATGKGMLHAAELAAAEANEAGAIPGWELKVVAADDKGDPEVAADAVRELVADDSVVAVMGSIFSGATREEIPVFAEAGIPQISSMATNPALTRGEDWATNPVRQYDSFFRVCPPDNDFAPTIAEHLHSKGMTRAATVVDGTDYANGFTAAFTTRFTELGGEVIDAGAIEPGTGESSAVVASVVAANVDAVVFGGYDVDAGPLSMALKAAGVQGPLVGGDAVQTTEYLTGSGITSAGDMAIQAGVPPETTEKGQEFLDNYRHRRYDVPATMKSAMGYDATLVIIEALKESLPASGGNMDKARAETTKALGRVSAEGLNGTVAFDSFGRRRTV